MDSYLLAFLMAGIACLGAATMVLAIGRAGGVTRGHPIPASA